MKSCFVIAALALCISNSVIGQTFNEGGDAGVTIATATNIPSGTVLVNGTVDDSTPADVDLYRFQPLSSGLFTLSVNSDDIDASILVFNAFGQGLAGDDDDDSSCDSSLVPMLGSLDSCLTLNLTAGINYFVAVGESKIAAYENNAAFISMVSIIVPGDKILSSPTVEVLGFVSRVSGALGLGGDGLYQLHLASSSPPPISDPAVIPTTPLYIMFVMASCLMALARSRIFKS